EEIYSKAVELQYMPQEVKEEQLSKIIPYLENASFEERKNMALIDGGLVAMQLMLVARAHGYDTCPIGGFEKDKIVEALGMDKERYIPVMLVSIGKADDTGYPSVRLPIDKITEWK